MISIETNRDLLIIKIVFLVTWIIFSFVIILSIFLFVFKRN